MLTVLEVRSLSITDPVSTQSPLLAWVWKSYIFLIVEFVLTLLLATICNMGYVSFLILLAITGKEKGHTVRQLPQTKNLLKTTISMHDILSTRDASTESVLLQQGVRDLSGGCNEPINILHCDGIYWACIRSGSMPHACFPHTQRNTYDQNIR